MAIVMWTSLAMALEIPIDIRISAFYPSIVKEVQDHGLSGPIALEVAPYAQLRRIHEDGLDRPTDISYNGMVPGSPNKEVIQKLCMPDHTVGRVSSNDGQGCYSIKGPRANVMGAVAIALWYDAIVNSDRFRICNAEERKIWNESRHCSHMIAIGNKHPKYLLKFRMLKMKRDRILQKVNSAYGPQGRHINQMRAKLHRLFDLSLE